MASSGQVFMLECSSCGAKITSSGSTVGGNASCNPHAYGPIIPATSPTQRRPIVYPTDAERNWLRIIDQNKAENTTHSHKFRSDVLELNKLKSTAMQEITTMIKTLRSKLDDRQDELERELASAFEKRRDKMNDNINALKEHKSKNEETKDNSEDLLADGDKPESEREKIIVEACEKIIKSTPRLKYIETELRYTFDQLHSIERKISQFGILVTKPIDSGIKCIFKSTSDATNAPSPAGKVKNINVPIIQLKNSTFDDNKQKVKLSFKVIQKTENKDVDIDIMKFLQIHINCAQDVDDEKTDDLTVIHEETLPFKHCNMHPNGKKYEVHVNKKFNPGITVAFKIKPLFESPNRDKYASCEGKWSREQTYEIPEEEENNAIFHILLNGKAKTLSLEDDDVALTNFDKFVSKFMNVFKVSLQDDQRLELSTSDGVLNEKSKLASYATDSYVIRGDIIYLQVEQPPPKAAYATSPKVVSPQKKAVTPKKREARGGGGGGRVGPKQISTIVVYGDTKKRVVLKNNAKKNLYEYTMDTLRTKLSKKFAGKGLKGHFDLKTDDGQSIEQDQHIVEYLAEYKGEIQVTQ